MTTIRTVTKSSIVDFMTGEIIPIPFELQAIVDESVDFTLDFYLIKLLLPFGLEEREGELIICGDVWGASICIKAWRFEGDNSWQRVEMEPDVSGVLIDIEYYESSPHETTRFNWTPPGKTKIFSSKNEGRAETRHEAFREFILRINHL